MSFFYNQLQETASSCRDDIILVMGDLNARVRNNITNREEVIGTFGIGVLNDNGERLCEFGSAIG